LWSGEWSGTGNSPVPEPVIPVMANQSRAVQFDQYGDIDVLEVRDVPRPQAGPGEVLVKVKAAAINPGEAMIRRGALHDRWPSTFPSGQGSDFAGVVAGLGDGAHGVRRWR
jgi:NADPH:quinone reductase-like Zn-dependent oxidoreductase